MPYRGYRLFTADTLVYSEPDLSSQAGFSRHLKAAREDVVEILRWWFQKSLKDRLTERRLFLPRGGCSENKAA